MDILKDKQYASYDYKNRYTSVPYYYNTVDKKEIYGLGSNVSKDNITWVAHTVTQSDSLDSLALNYYNNPTFWWVIAYFNDIQDSFEPLITRFNIIKIPNISSISFGDER